MLSSQFTTKIKEISNQKVKEYNDFYVGVVPAHSNHQLPGPMNIKSTPPATKSFGHKHKTEKHRDDMMLIQTPKAHLSTK